MPLAPVRSDHPAAEPSLFERIGAKLGIPAPSSEQDLVDLVTARLPVEAVSVMAGHGLSADDVHRLILPRRTLSHRRARGERLSREESDRAVRVARIVALADLVFGDEITAGRWLRKPKQRFGGHTPMQMLATEAGARLVEEFLYQIDDGLAA
jgi:putative toxin-antitoxin system antitoxin component (TIGR02293 family)